MFLKEGVTLSRFSSVQIHGMAAIYAISIQSHIGSSHQFLMKIVTPTTSIGTGKRHFNMLMKSYTKSTSRAWISTS